jgi:ribosomal protein S18 acetylase RimI-like enzyme
MIFMTIRYYEQRDEDAVYEVCLKTGEAGQDATSLYSDPKALGHIFVGPYLHLEPELAWVLEDRLGVCGYVLGALDSARFYKMFLEQWLVELRRRYSEPSGDPALWTPTEKISHQCHHPEVYYPESFRAYRSHLHIDLLPRAQGQGHGQRMMDTLLEQLRQRASPGVHLGMDSRNSRAKRFYERLGFIELSRVRTGQQETLYLGKKL